MTQPCDDVTLRVGIWKKAIHQAHLFTAASYSIYTHVVFHMHLDAAAFFLSLS